MWTLLQEALDSIEVCLQALGRPVTPLKYAVDFGSLPFVPIPPAEPAQAALGSSGGDDSGPAEDAPPSADEATTQPLRSSATPPAKLKTEVRLASVPLMLFVYCVLLSYQTSCVELCM